MYSWAAQVLKHNIQSQLNVITEQFRVKGNEVETVFVTSMVLREEKEEKVLGGSFKSKGRAFLCFTKDVIDPHVYYINIYFSFFIVTVYVKCIDKFRLLHFEFYAQCCSGGVKGSKKHLLNMFVHHLSPLTLN